MKNWIQTYTGRRVDPTDMSLEDVDIEDIAHALALTNRFTGHTPEPYSVAQHSVIVSVLCPVKCKMWGLLHDAAEAYFADISRPVKVAIAETSGRVLTNVEARIMNAVCARFNLPFEEPAEVKVADDTALANEAFSFFGSTPNYKHWQHRFDNGYKSMGFKIVPVPWQEAERRFLRRFDLLNKI